MDDDEDENGRDAVLKEEKLRVEIEATIVERKRWSEQADEDEKEAKRLRAEARLLRKEAKEKERRRRELVGKLDKDRRLKKLRYELLRLRLKRNDPTVVSVNTRDFPQGHGEDLRVALLHNTMVKTLVLNISQFLPTKGYLASKGKPLLDFLSDSPSLVNLQVDGPLERRNSLDTRNVSHAILKTISKSKCIEELSWDLPVSPLAFHDLMKNSKTLRELDIGFAEQHHSYSIQDYQMIASGFATGHAQLESLALYLGESEQMVIGILDNLHRVPSMKKLALIAQGYRDDGESYDRILEAAAGFLQSTRTLERLQLEGFDLTDSLMRIVLEGLTQYGDDMSVPATFVQQLAFLSCGLADGALGRLLAFLQTRTTSLDGTVLYQSCLRELSIDRGFLESDQMLTDEDRTKQFVASLLMAPCAESPKLLPTIASQIETLFVFAVKPDFLLGLADNADRVQLRNLQLCGTAEDAAKVLPTVLPKLTSIQELTMDHIAGGVPARCIVKAVERSSSIVAFSSARRYPLNTDWDDEYYRIFDSTELRLIQAYCDRNRFFATLFESEGSKETEHDTESMASVAIVDSSEPVEVDAIQYPALFKAAVPVPAKLSRSLLKFGRTVGPADLS